MYIYVCGLVYGRPIAFLVFFSHNRHMTTFEHPISGHPVMNPPDRTPPQSPISKGSRKSSGKSRSIKTPAASRGQNSKVIMRGWLQKQVHTLGYFPLNFCQIQFRTMYKEMSLNKTEKNPLL